MKKLINQIDSVVTEQMEGLIATWPHLQANYSPRYVWCKQNDNAVALVSGGGSGHEPLHAGFVGMGMLTGACPGEVFTSPTPDQMIECAKAVDNGSGVLFLSKITLAIFLISKPQSRCYTKKASPLAQSLLMMT